MCSGFLRRLGALALCVVLLGALGGCGSAARPGSGTGCPLPGGSGDLGDVAEEKSEYSVGEVASAGNCRMQLSGYSYEQVIGYKPDWEKEYIVIGILVKNDSDSSVQIGDKTYLDCQKEIYTEWDTLWSTVAHQGDTEKIFENFFNSQCKKISNPMTTVTLEGKELSCITVGMEQMSNSPSIAQKVIPSKTMGGVMILCEVPRGWEELNITYRINGESVKFLLPSFGF